MESIKSHVVAVTTWDRQGEHGPLCHLLLCKAKHLPPPKTMLVCWYLSYLCSMAHVSFMPRDKSRGNSHANVYLEEQEVKSASILHKYRQGRNAA